VSRTTNQWVVFAGCFLLSIGVNAFMIAPSSITPLFVARFGIERAAVGDIVSAAIAGSILTQIPGGYLLDRYDNRWLLTPAFVLFGLVVVAIQWVGGFVPFLGLRALGGVVGGFAFTGGANVVGEVFAGERRSLATGLFMTSPPVAFFLAHTTSPFVGTAFGPLRVFVVHAAVAAAGLGLFWVGAGSAIRSAGTPTAAEFTRALGDRRVLLLSVSTFAAYALYLFLNTWVPTYGTEVLSLSIAQAGILTGLVPLVGVFARTGGGWLSARLGGRRRPVLAGGLLTGLVFLVAMPFAGGFLPFLVLLVVGAFAIQLGTGVYYVLIRELAAPGTEGTSLTVMTTVGFVGSFIAPILGGWLIEGYSWPIAFGAFAAIGALGVVVLVPLSEGERPATAAAGPDTDA
jgi:MFS family permease